MKVAVINNFDSFVYNLVRYLHEAQCTIEVFRNDQIDLDALEQFDAILLSPGPGIPSEAGQMFEVIERFHSSKKMLGVCLGHQAIAEVLGGSIIQSKSPMHGKASQIQQEDSVFFRNISKTILVGRYHSWRVDQLPENFVCTAQTESGEIMAMKHRELPLFGVQFHPESILTPDGRQMINNWINA